MQTIPAALPENLIYGIQLWKLNCLYFDGHNYRYSRSHRAVDPSQRGRVAVPVNRALKRRFASPAELSNASRGIVSPMPIDPRARYLGVVLPAGSAVYTVITNESRTGANCRLLVLAVRGEEIISVTTAVAELLEMRLEHGELQVTGPRGLAGGRLVQRLALALHGDAGSLMPHSLPAPEGGRA